MGSETTALTKHRQVLDSVHNRICSGNYRPGDRIPSELNLVEEFGVSRPTVAKALRELEKRGLVQRRRGSGTYVTEKPAHEFLFALLIPGLGDSEVFEPICSAMGRAVQRDGHSMFWGAAHPRDEQLNGAMDLGAAAWEIAQRFIRSKVTGVFFAPLELIPNKDAVNRRIVTAFDDARIPVVLLDRDYVQYPGRSEHDLVGVNNRRVGHTITNHLFEAGCENLVFVLRPGSASTIHARSAGFAEAFSTRKVPFDFNRIYERDPSDRDAIRRMLQERDPDGIVCGNDVTAGYLLHTLDELNVRVPNDVLIGGVDDVKYASLLRVPLSTVRQPFEAIGAEAYHTMLDRIRRPGAPPRHVTLGCELVVRDSTRAVS